jgi:uncharacterized protein (UPF0335 family)
MGDNSVAKESLSSFVQRIEKLNEEVKEIQADRKAVYEQAKFNGFDTKVIRRVIRERAMDKEELDEFNLLTQTYWEAIS